MDEVFLPPFMDEHVGVPVGCGPVLSEIFQEVNLPSEGKLATPAKTIEKSHLRRKKHHIQASRM